MKHKNCEAFVGLCINNMMTNGVSIEIVKTDRNASETYSYFESGNVKPKFCIRYLDNSFYENMDVFVHEYCHFLQWKADTKLQKSYESAHYRYYSRWLRKLHCKYMLLNDVRDDLRIIQSVELDCDRRAIKLIKKYNLEIDSDKYIRRSNSYILSYNYSFEKRKDFKVWPFDYPGMIELVPAHHLKTSELGLIIPEHREIFLKNCK